MLFVLVLLFVMPWRSFGLAATSGVNRASAAMKTDVVFASDKRPVVLFDGVCNMCNFWVNFVLDNDASPGKLRFAALQSEIGRALLERSGRRPDDISSIVLVEASQAHIKSDAVLRIGEILGIPSLARSVIPPLFADSVYDIHLTHLVPQVADNRYKFLGQSASCRLSDDGFAERFLTTL